ncbi:MAG: HD domain-containing protein [Peptococcaceae bacterium]|nr:HD domain-containing protein [Peptococcaceae bacterium]
MEEKYEKLKEIVYKELSYAAHDLDHVMRVYHYCLYFAEEEKEADPKVLIPAALLHDIARKQEDEDPTGKIDHAVLGAELAEKILRDLHFEPLLIEKIKKCIRAHRFRSGYSPDTIEAKILFDADKLDVIGAVGIARSYMLAGQHGERMYSDIPIAEYMKENVGENGRIKDVTKHTMNLEYELKLKMIPQRLFTERAKKIAEKRIDYMENFFDTLRNEIAGKN